MLSPRRSWQSGRNEKASRAHPVGLFHIDAGIGQMRSEQHKRALRHISARARNPSLGPRSGPALRLRNEIERCGFFQRHAASIRPSNPGHNLSKIGHPLRRPQSRASVRQTERVLLRTTIAQILYLISPIFTCS